MPRQPVPTPAQILPKKKLTATQGLVGSIRVPTPRVAKTQQSIIAETIRRGMPSILRALEVTYQRDVEEAVTQEQLHIQNLGQEELLAESRMANRRQAGQMEKQGLFSAFQNPVRQVAKMEALGKRWFNEHYVNELSGLRKRLVDPNNMEDPLEAEAALFAQQDLGDSSIFRRTVGQLRQDERARFNLLVQGDRDKNIKKLNISDAEADMAQLADTAVQNPLIDYRLDSKEAEELRVRAQQNQNTVDNRPAFGPEQEGLFREWYGGVRELQGMPPGDPDGQKYDYRGLFLTGQTPEQVIGPKGHLTDEYKLPGHPTLNRTLPDGTVATEGGLRLKEAIEARMNELHALDPSESGEKQAISSVRGILEGLISDENFEGARAALDIFASVNARGLGDNALGDVARIEFETMAAAIEDAEDIFEEEEHGKIEVHIRRADTIATTVGSALVGQVLTEGRLEVSDEEIVKAMSEATQVMIENGVPSDVAGRAAKAMRIDIKGQMKTARSAEQEESDPDALTMAMRIALDRNMSASAKHGLIANLGLASGLSIEDWRKIDATVASAPTIGAMASKFLAVADGGVDFVTRWQRSVEGRFDILLDRVDGDDKASVTISDLKAKAIADVRPMLHNIVSEVIAETPDMSEDDRRELIRARLTTAVDDALETIEQSPDFRDAKRITNSVELRLRAKPVTEKEAPAAVAGALGELQAQQKLVQEGKAPETSLLPRVTELRREAEAFVTDLTRGGQTFTILGATIAVGGGERLTIEEDGVHRHVRQRTDPFLEFDRGVDEQLTEAYRNARQLTGFTPDEVLSRKTDEGVLLRDVDVNPARTLFFRSADEFEAARNEFDWLNAENRAEESIFQTLLDSVSTIKEYDISMEQFLKAQDRLAGGLP